MAQTPKPYTRLTRPRSGVGTYSSLWRAADHLLVVNSTGFNESYRRFYFRDIKGFILTESKRYFYYNIVSGIVLLLSLLPLMLDLSDGVGLSRAMADSFPMMFIAVPALIVLVVNLIKGPSCNIAVATGLQSPRLTPVGRKRAWRKLHAKIDAPIRETQAALLADAAVVDAPSTGEAEPEAPTSTT